MYNITVWFEFWMDVKESQFFIWYGIANLKENPGGKIYYL